MNHNRIQTVIKLSTVTEMNQMLMLEQSIDHALIKDEIFKDAISVFSKIRKAIIKLRNDSFDSAMEEIFSGTYKKAKQINFSTINDCCLASKSIECELLNSFYEESENQELIEHVDRFCKARNIGYVYLIKGTHNGEIKYKIGKATDLKQRINRFEVIIPFDIDIVYAVRVKNPLELESLLHKTFAEKRAQGEWFNFTQEEILLVIFSMKYLSGLFDGFSKEWNIEKEKQNKLDDDDYIDYLESLLVMNNVSFDNQKRLNSGKTI
jgi:hypothetical protein